MIRRRLLAVSLAAFAALTLPLTSAEAATTASAPRVIGGSDISISDSPWQVLFLINSGTVCSGSLVSRTQIVSVAHCFAGASTSKVHVWAGITDISERSADSELKIAKITNHPDFNADTFANDVALVTLAKPVKASLATRTIALPVNQDPSTWPAAGTTALISGWGETKAGSPIASNTLRGAQIEILTSPAAAACGDYGDAYLPGMQICGGEFDGSIDACQGDSGGPLVVSVNGTPTLAGAGSTGQACATANYPGLYTRMTTYLPWLATQGVDLAAAGKDSATATPGSTADGVPSRFEVGQRYAAGDFAAYAKLPQRGAKVAVISGKSCKLIGTKVAFTSTGKCYLKVTNGLKSARLVVTTY